MSRSTGKAEPASPTRRGGAAAAGKDTRSAPTFWVNEAIGRAQPRTYGWLVVALCTFIGMTEGYDVAAMSLAAPLLARLWQLSPAQLGLLLSSSVIGLVLGSFLLSPLGDRWGRRRAVLLGLAIAGSATAAGAIASGWAQMLGYRLIAGAGLGMALPNTVTLAMELVPWRMRNLAVVMVSSGLALGGGIGAAIIGQYVGRYGFAVIFQFGAATSLVAFLLSAAFLPEAPLILVRRGADATVRTLVRRLTGEQVPAVCLGYRTEPVPHSTVRALFAGDRRRPTLLLWVLNFANTGMIYFFLNWIPTLVVARGQSAAVGIRASALFAISGVIGSLVGVWLLRRTRAVTLLIGAYALAALTALGLAFVAGVDAMFFILLALSAAAGVGAQFCLNALVTQYYPASIRATGSAYATGAGRIGAILAPAGAGLLFGILGTTHAFGFAIAPALIAITTVALLGGSGALGRGSQQDD